MSTRCTITVGHRAVYCHFDGYPEHTGELLNNNYNSKDKANELVDNGDMSQLGHSIATTRFYGPPYDKAMTPEEAADLQGISYRYVYNEETNYWECYKGGS